MRMEILPKLSFVIFLNASLLTRIAVAFVFNQNDREVYVSSFRGCDSRSLIVRPHGGPHHFTNIATLGLMSGTRRKSHKDNDPMPTHPMQQQIPWGKSPYLALITETDACASLKRVEETISAIEQATIDGGVTLVVVRVPDDESYERKWTLIQKLAELKQHQQYAGKAGFYLVINNELELAIQAISQNIALDGVHVKEHDANQIPSIRKRLHDTAEKARGKTKTNEIQHNKHIIIGTSCHSKHSAIGSYQLSPRGPDYLFVGTCYLTQSHPEKTAIDQLEGPTLPGTVKKELYQLFDKMDKTESQLPPPEPPKIFAIGGIDEQNCHEPVLEYGADGVATIRAVMQASDPRCMVQDMKHAMQKKINGKK